MKENCSPSPLSPFRRRALALFYGCVVHALFLVAVAMMAWSLFLGMTPGFGRLEGGAAVVANALLLLQFPLVHSWLLNGGGKKVYRFLAPAAARATLAPTLYGILASLQVLLLFAAWSPIGEPIVVIEGPVRIACWIGSVLAWLLLAKSMHDANLALQSGALGWLALWRGERPNYGGLPTGGLFRVCRQPIYLSFAAITWTGPVWTLDHLIVALGLTAYCLVGPFWKERRFEQIHGAAFHEYRARVPYLPGWGRHDK